MEFLQELKSWIPFFSFVLTAVVLAFNWFSHQKIVGNDLHHLSAGLKNIGEKQDKQDEKINNMATDIAYIKGKEENHSRTIKILEKIINN